MTQETASGEVLSQPALNRATLARQAVRAPLMRATVHLTSARDAQFLWPQMLPVLERNLRTGTSGSSALRPEMITSHKRNTSAREDCKGDER